LTVLPVVSGELRLKIRWDFARTLPRAGDLCDERVQWHPDASTTKGCAPEPEEKKEVPEWKGIPEKSVNDSYSFILCHCLLVSHSTTQLLSNSQSKASSSFHTLTISLAPQACASQPRCLWGKSPSMISGTWLTHPWDRRGALLASHEKAVFFPLLP
jgi:hypothetical protein